MPPRTREEMIAAAQRARAARSAKAKERRRMAKAGSAGRATSSGAATSTRGAAHGGIATATKPRRRMVRATAGTTGVRTQRSKLQPIVADADYPLPVFCEFTGLTTAAIRRCQRDGLIVRRRGNKRFVSGADWIEWNRQQRDQEEPDGQ